MTSDQDIFNRTVYILADSRGLNDPFQIQAAIRWLVLTVDSPIT